MSSSRHSGVQQENLSLACLSEEEDLWRRHWNFTDSKEKVGIQASGWEAVEKPGNPALRLTREPQVLLSPCLGSDVFA